MKAISHSSSPTEAATRSMDGLPWHGLHRPVVALGLDNEEDRPESVSEEYQVWDH